jgi:trk system potassium uptake protein TrkA
MGNTKSILVIGMGRFGRYLALKMQEFGNSVMVVDSNVNIESDISSHFDDYIIGDCTNEIVMNSLGISDFDICFVTIGENFESSIIITSLLNSHGAKHIVTKADRDVQADVLKKIGADEVVYSERELAEKLAVRYNMDHVFDFIELAGGYSVFEIDVPPSWIKKEIQFLNLRNVYKVSILAIKNGNEVQPIPESNYVFRNGDVIILLGREKDIARLS